MIMKWLLSLSILHVINLACAQEQPATFTARVGQSNQLPLRIAGEDQPRCNMEFQIPGGGSIERELIAPDYFVTLDVTPQIPGAFTIQYQGKTKFRGFNTVAGCNAKGQIQVEASLGAQANKQSWEKHLASLTAERAECVRFGVRRDQLPIESADPAATLVAINHPSARAIFAKCDDFFQKPQPRKNYDCVIGGNKTRCDRVYAERQTDGKLRAITLERAFQLHFDGDQWTTGQMETVEARQGRLAQEAEAERSRAEAERAAAERARVESERRRVEAERVSAEKARASAAAAAERSRGQQEAERERTPAQSSAPSRPAPAAAPATPPESPASKPKPKVGTALDI